MGESYASLFHLGLKLINIPIRKHLSVAYKVCLCVCVIPITLKIFIFPFKYASRLKLL